jgi:superfamily II DNA or RNA helicase
MSIIPKEQIGLFFSLFRGREDVFAIRWEKEGKSGYTPAYDVNWGAFAQHKAKGGSMKDFPDKSFAQLTEQRIINHLTGKEVIGLYPLLPDNTSWLIVADFDEAQSGNQSWLDECRTFIQACEEFNLPVYLERSRSGKGGHVWFFFDAGYPAYKSRKILLYILEKAGIISPFNKNSNYDRLFPNQDYHSGKGFGNLIALPLQKAALENNNSCFIDPVSEVAYPNQWIFLQTIKKITTGAFDEICAAITKELPGKAIEPSGNTSVAGDIQIQLSNQIVLSRSQLPSTLVLFLREQLNFVNADYIIKKRLGKNTFGTEPYFKMLEEKGDTLLLPKGFAGKLLRFCKDQSIGYQLTDERCRLSEVRFVFNAELHNYQQQAVDAANSKDFGVIAAPPGSGKTIIALAIVAQKKQPALIIVHRKQLFDQWVERIQSFLGIAEAFIGKIAPDKQKIGTHITVTMIQSLAALYKGNDLFSSFGTIIIDECHHVPAKTFRQVIGQFSSYYLYGVTATPIRKNNDEKLIFIHIGEVIHEVGFSKENGPAQSKIAITVRETNLLLPFDYKTDKPETLYQVLIHDTGRNQLIVEDIKAEVAAGRKVLVLTERKAHIETLHQYMKSQCEVMVLSGDDAEATRKSKLKQIKAGQFQVLITTGQFFGEGADFDNLDCLVLAYPFSFEGKLVQYIGRVQRGEGIPIIYDYRDMHIDYLEQQFRQRNRYYKKLLNTGQVAKFDELILILNENRVMVNSAECTLPISCLDLPIEIESFKEAAAWRIRVLQYDEVTGELVAEIMDYQANPEMNNLGQRKLQFLIIDTIKFRAMDTIQLLRIVKLKKSAIAKSNDAAVQPIVEHPSPTKESTLVKTMKVPFQQLLFSNACVSFSIYVEELAQTVPFEIANPDIRPEFEAVKDYFMKVLKKKMVVVELEIIHADGAIITVTASSEDIDQINSNLIDSVRFQLVKKNILGFKGNDRAMNTLDGLLSGEAKSASALFQSEQDLIEKILAIKDAKHYHQLKYLSARHLSGTLKIRFVLNPFSFIFLLAGETQYHIIWETLNSEEATYIWHFDKSLEALRKGLGEVETILHEIKASNKIQYLKEEYEHFSRVMHDYSDTKSGFVVWKGMLEGRLG